MTTFPHSLGQAVSIVLAGATLAMLAGCSVRLSVDDAIARDATEPELRQIARSGERASGIGRWTYVAAVLDRATLRRITRWELYSSLLIVDCATGKMTNIIAGPHVEDASTEDFGALKQVLAAHPQRSVFAMTGFIFSRPGDWRRPQCIRLDGGSATLQKIASDPVPIRFAGTRD